MVDPASGAAIWGWITGAAAGSISTYSFAAIATTIVVNLAISAILGKLLAPRMGKSSTNDKGMQNIVRDNVLPRRIVYGEALVGGPYAYLETTGNTNEWLNMIVVLTGHPVEDVIGIFINDQYIDISDATGGANLDSNYFLQTGRYGQGAAEEHIKIIKNNGWGYADNQYVTDKTESWVTDDRTRAAAIASNVIENTWSTPVNTTRDSNGLYGSGYKLTNCAHIFVGVKYNRDVWSGFPTLKFHVKGKRLYNPSLDSTSYIGGTGSQDITDPDTYTWSEDWSLCILDYLLNTSYGMGAKVDQSGLVEIDWAEAISAYEASSEVITTGDTSYYQSTAPRYTINGTLETSSTPISNMEAMLTSGAGSIVYAQGAYKLRPGIYREPNSSDDIINEDMIVSALSINTHTPRSDIFNKAAGVYVDKGYKDWITRDFSNKPSFEPSDFAIVDPLDSSGLNPYEEVDGEEIIREFDFPLTTREYEAQRLARIQLERIRQGLTISFEANLKMLKFSVGDTVYLEILNNSKYANESFFNRLGLDDEVQLRPDSPYTAYYKQFKILDMQYTNNATIAVILTEEAEEIYDWNNGDANVTDHVLESEIISSDPTGTVLPPTFLVSSPYETIVEDIGEESGTTVTTLIRWNAVDRGSLTGSLDRVHTSHYNLEYGIVTDPSNVDLEARVSTWIGAGSKVADHDNYIQGPLALETLHKGDDVYDFRVNAVTYSGRRSVWAYYSDEVGSDYDPTPPLASTTDLYYIKPIDGTAIKNGTGTLTIEAHLISGGIDTVLSSPYDVELYDNSTYRGSSHTYGTDDINGALVVELRENTSPYTILDTITLVDIDDGGISYYGYIEATNGFAFTRAINSGTWSPDVSSTNLEFTVVQGGNVVAQQGWQIGLTQSTGLLTNLGSVAHSTSPGNFADSPGDIQVDVVGVGTQAATVTFTYTNGSDTLVVGETVLTAIGGADGADGADGAAGVDGSDGADGAAGTDSRTVNLTADQQAFLYLTNDTLDPAESATTTITATALNTGGTPWYEFFLNDASQQDSTSNTWTYTPQSDYADMPDKVEVHITEDGVGGTVYARDQITIYGIKPGVDAPTIILSNETHSIQVDSPYAEGDHDYSDSGTTIEVYLGASPLAYDDSSPYANSSFRVSSVADTNITVDGSPTENANDITYGNVSLMTADTASIAYALIIKNAEGIENAVTRVQTFSRSKQGVAGADGADGADGIDGAAGADGAAGTDSRTVNLTAGQMSFLYLTNDTLDPAESATTTVTATALNTGGTPWYEFFLNDVSQQDTTSNTWTYTPQGDYADMPDKVEVHITEDGAGGTIYARDQITMNGLKPGVDAPLVVFSNEATTVSVDYPYNEGDHDYAGSGTKIEVYLGTSAIAYDDSAPYATPSFRVTSIVDTNITADGTPTENANDITYGPSSLMTSDAASIQFNLTIKNNEGIETTLARWQTITRSKQGDPGTAGADGSDGLDGAAGADGSDGTDSRTVNLTAGQLAFLYLTDDTLDPTESANTTFTATALNTVGTPYYEFFLNDASQQDSTSNTWTYTPQADYADMPDKVEVHITEDGVGGTVYARDQVTVGGIKPGVDAPLIIQTNEAHSVPVDSPYDEADHDYAGSGNTIDVYLGATQLTYDDTPSYSNPSFRITSATGTNVTVGTQTNNAFGVISLMTADTAYITYTILVRNAEGIETAVTRIQSITRSKQGATGAAGADGINGADGADGSAGADARAINLTAGQMAFLYLTDDTLDPAENANTTVTATALNTEGTPWYEFFLNDASQQDSTSNTWTYTPQADYANMPDKVEVHITEDGAGGTIYARDQITMHGIKPGVDAPVVVLSNEAHTIASIGGIYDYTGSGTMIRVFLGDTAIAYDDTPTYASPSFRVTSAAGTSITPDATPTENSNDIVYGDASAITDVTASINYTIVVVNNEGIEVTFTRVQSFSVSSQVFSASSWPDPDFDLSTGFGTYWTYVAKNGIGNPGGGHSSSAAFLTAGGDNSSNAMKAICGYGETLGGTVTFGTLKRIRSSFGAWEFRILYKTVAGAVGHKIKGRIVGFAAETGGSAVATGESEQVTLNNDDAYHELIVFADVTWGTGGQFWEAQVEVESPTYSDADEAVIIDSIFVRPGSRPFGGAGVDNTGHVPDPVTEEGKFLKDDGTWAAAGSVHWGTATADEDLATVTPTDLSYPEYDPRRYGATHSADPSPSGTDNSAAFTEAVSVGEHTIPVRFSGQVGDVTLTNNLNGYNQGVIYALDGSATVFDLVKDTARGVWNHKVMENILIDCTGSGSTPAIRTVNGFQYPLTPSTTDKTLAGRTVFRSVHIENANIGIYQPTGNFGNHLYHCNITGCNYGIFGQESNTPQIMHPGLWNIIGGQIAGSKKAAIYMNCDTESANGFRIDNCSIEDNQGHGLYFDGWNLASDGPVLNAVHFEGNDNDDDGTIDLGHGRGVETIRDLMCHDVDHIVINKTHATADAGFEFNNSMALMDGCFLNMSSKIVADSDSVVRMVNANLDGMSGNAANVIVESLTQQRRQATDGATMYARIKPRDHIIHKLPGTGTALYSETFAHELGFLSGSTGTITSGGGNCGLYKNHARFSSAVSTSYIAGTSEITNGWYVYTFDMMLESSALENVRIYTTTDSQYLVAGFDNILENHITDGDWTTLGGVTEWAGGTKNVRFQVQTTSGAAPFFNMGPLQLIRFDTQKEAIDYFNSGAFYQETDYSLVSYPRTQLEIDNNITPTDYFYEPGNVFRYGAVADSSLLVQGTDNTTAFQNAVDSHHPVYVPEGFFAIEDTVLILSTGGTEGGKTFRMTSKTRLQRYDNVTTPILHICGEQNYVDGGGGIIAARNYGGFTKGLVLLGNDPAETDHESELNIYCFSNILKDLRIIGKSANTQSDKSVGLYIESNGRFRGDWGSPHVGVTYYSSITAITSIQWDFPFFISTDSNAMSFSHCMAKTWGSSAYCINGYANNFQNCKAEEPIAHADFDGIERFAWYFGRKNDPFTPETGTDKDCPFTNITGMSNATECVVTSAGHGLSTGDKIKIEGVNDSGAGTLEDVVNEGHFQITYVSPSTFKIPVDTTGLATWSSGGVVKSGFYILTAASQNRVDSMTETSGTNGTTRICRMVGFGTPIGAYTTSNWEGTHHKNYISVTGSNDATGPSGYTTRASLGSNIVESQNVYAEYTRTHKIHDWEYTQLDTQPDTSKGLCATGSFGPPQYKTFSGRMAAIDQETCYEVLTIDDVGPSTSGILVKLDYIGRDASTNYDMFGGEVTWLCAITNDTERKPKRIKEFHDSESQTSGWWGITASAGSAGGTYAKYVLSYYTGDVPGTDSNKIYMAWKVDILHQSLDGTNLDWSGDVTVQNGSSTGSIPYDNWQSKTKIKTSDEARKNTTAVAIDSDLSSWGLEANTEYVLSGQVLVQTPSSSNPDVRFAWDFTSSPDSGDICIHMGDGTHAAYFYDENDVTQTILADNIYVFAVNGWFKTNAAATLHLKWAQRVQDPTYDTIIKAGSYITIKRFHKGM